MDLPKLIQVYGNISKAHQFIIDRNITTIIHNLMNLMHNVLGPFMFRTSTRMKYNPRIVGNPTYEK